MDGISRSFRWDMQVIWMGYAGHMDGIHRAYGWDKEILHIILCIKLYV